MPTKLRRLPGLKGLYYRRKFPKSYRGKSRVRYKGKTYQKYSYARDKARHAKTRRKKGQPAHWGDRIGWI